RWGRLGPVKRGPQVSCRVVIRRAAAALVALAWLVAPAPGPRIAVAGHGGVVQLNRAAAGPYALSVWTQPTPPRAGPLRVDVAVMRGGGVAVNDATVHV